MNNLILFPKTEQFYEEELTRFLQREQYTDAAQLLTFLLQFPHTDVNKSSQWEALLNWLHTMNPEIVFGSTPAAEDGRDEEKEEDLLRQFIQDKTSDDAAYIDKLLDMLKAGNLEQQVGALEQLAFVELPVACLTVRQWVSERPRHPHLQFKALQTLRQMGERGIVELPKNGKKIPLDIEETPLGPEDFPAQIRDMIRRVGEISEMSQPDFVFFAEQTWQEFLAYAYGTSVYTELLKPEEGAVDIWASALHAALQERMFGMVDREELLDTYGIVDSMTLQWRRAYSTLQTFIQQMIPNPS
ncbi:hypothetical protein [Paenibacillus aestuarii]|uniref:HEAT repeat domain-containing protein n=1 Tax=Paenibacillus aestuarii TaxID=516965 RepID=A0ABW0K397_9BACL|nr:hypothetical protein [Paenibacillus aestuarii]